MALRIAKLTTLFAEAYVSAFRAQGFTKTNIRPLVFTRSMSNNFTSQHSGEDAKIDDQEFQKWCNGGGMFHKSARIDPTARIEIGALIHSESVVGANVTIGSGSIVGPAVTIGQSTRTGLAFLRTISDEKEDNFTLLKLISYKVILSNCTIGDSCIIHHGVCIGQDGFGFFVDEEGLMVKKPQIGHNVEIGKSCMLCGQVGIAGSVTIGDYVTLGGRVSIRDHVCITSKVRLAANSCVTKNISEAGDYGGFPAIPIHDWRKQVVSVRQISKEFWHQKKTKS
ncbi:hypothetical protein DH2020_017328 [Rehmannia glutinosa]|uniref:UDP-3-O-acylglucosamine N-acyltransferase 2, mitochondrial n=1 Tax=Rehmannia glutinosa TaxID=99300 RepID=A0ABR0WQJ1_REHGL